MGRTQPPANRFDPIRGHWSSKNKIRRDFPISFPVVLAPVEHVKLRPVPHGLGDRGYEPGERGYARHRSQSRRELGGMGRRRQIGSQFRLGVGSFRKSRLRIYVPTPGRKPRTGRDSRAQGAAQRSPGLTVLQYAKAPTGRDSMLQIASTFPRNLGPLGLAPASFPHTQGCAGSAGSALGCRISPPWGFCTRNRNKNKQYPQEQHTLKNPRS